MWGYNEKSATQVRALSPPRWYLISDFQPPVLWEIYFCCLLATQSVVYCYSSPNGLRHPLIVQWRWIYSLDFTECWAKHWRSILIFCKCLHFNFPLKKPKWTSFLWLWTRHLTLSALVFFFLNGDTNYINLIRLLWGLNQLIYIKY